MTKKWRPNWQVSVNWTQKTDLLQVHMQDLPKWTLTWVIKQVSPHLMESHTVFPDYSRIKLYTNHKRITIKSPNIWKWCKRKKKSISVHFRWGHSIKLIYSFNKHSLSSCYTLGLMWVKQTCSCHGSNRNWQGIHVPAVVCLQEISEHSWMEPPEPGGLTLNSGKFFLL